MEDRSDRLDGLLPVGGIEEIARVLDSLLLPNGIPSLVERGDVFGPDAWIWLEATGVTKKVFCLARSPNSPRESILTIRSQENPLLDSWVTTTTTVIGPSDVLLKHNLTTAVTRHTAAVFGALGAMKAMTDGNIKAGLSKALSYVGIIRSEEQIEEEIPEMIEKVQKRGELN